VLTYQPDTAVKQTLVNSLV